MEIKIRKAKLSDAKKIAELSLQLGYQTDDKSTRKNLEKILNNEKHVIYVAELNEDINNIIAYIHCYTITVPYHNEVLSGSALIVDESKRNLGIGRKLMSSVEEWGKSKGASAFVFYSNVKREPAHLLYKKMGYKKIKKQFFFLKDFV